MKALSKLTWMGSFATWALSSFALVLVIERLGLFERFHNWVHAQRSWTLDFILLVLLLLLLFLFLRVNRRLGHVDRERCAAMSEVQRIAFHDALTGLPNRRFLQQHVEAAEARARAGDRTGMTLLLLDLDRFKPVNDLRGHGAGDLLLCEAARRLREVAPEASVVARLGGDEFVLAVNGVASLGEILALRVLAAVARPFEIEDWSATLSCSIGIATWTPGVPAAELLRRADQAMYRAKQAGRSGYTHFDASLGEALRERAALEHDLRQALAEGTAIMPFFQPIYDITGRRLRSFEVLARWNDPVRGDVLPDQFVPLAEEIGLIDRLSDLVLDRACAALAEWTTDLPIAFNLSPRQFGDPSLPGRILAVLERHGIPGSRLEIEITERAVLADLEVARSIIWELAASGVRVSLDDFGAGMSSLAILTQLPVDSLKIDRSFISGVDLMPHKEKIVVGVLALADSLGLRVTAEGIERNEELSFLSERNCALGQGYLLGRPLPAAGIATLLGQENEMDERRLIEA